MPFSRDRKQVIGQNGRNMEMFVGGLKREEEERYGVLGKRATDGREN